VFYSGAPAAPDVFFYYYPPELLLISKVKPIEKYFAIEPRSGTKCQLHSQCKPTMLRRENQKIGHENVILKAN
jgi:hypothetical protein